MLLVSLLLSFSSAQACGQSTHVWTSLHALEHLPDGPLHDLLSRDALRPMLVHGTMFPDGGYSPISRHPYGENAHWEPFHSRYLQWIEQNHDDPTTGEGAEHLAFLMGMISHGIGDQVFDAAYLTRSQVYDADIPGGWAQSNVDFASDVAMVARVGPQPLLDAWVPWSTMVTLFEEHGVPVDEATLRRGQESLRIAIATVGGLGSDPESAAPHIDAYPWANAHLLDVDVPGSPACVGQVVANFWQIWWDRLHGGFNLEDRPLIATMPTEGAGHHPRDASHISSMISLVVSVGLEASSVSNDLVTLTGDDGDEIPVDVRLYYRQDSHVLNIQPQEDLAEDTIYTLRLLPGLEGIDGSVYTGEGSLRFSTGLPLGGYDPNKVPVPADPDAADPTVCGCAQGSRLPYASAALLALISLRRRSPAPTAPA